MIQNITAQLGEGNIRSKSRGLTDYALMWAFDNMRYVARRASTPMPSETREFSYPYFDLETVLAQQAELLSPGGKAARAESKIERKSGYTETYGFAEEVNDHQRAEANGTAVDWDRQCTINVTRGCEKAREAEWKRVALNAASWTGKLTGQDAAVTVTGGTNPWGDAQNQVFQKWSANNVDIIQQMLDLRTLFIERADIEPNICVLGAKVGPVAINDDNVIDRLKGGQTSGYAQASLMDLQTAFMVDTVIVQESLESMGSFFNDSDIFYGYVAPTLGMNTPTSIAMPYWTPFKDGQDLALRRYEMVETENRVIEAKVSFSAHVVSPELALVMKGAV